MKRTLIINLLACAFSTQAYFDGTNQLATEATVLWGNDILSGDSMTGMIDSAYAGGYTNVATFYGAAFATATYDTVSIALIFNQADGFYLGYTQHIIRAKAIFTDTLVVSGPIGTGSIAYSESIEDSVTTTSLHVEDEPTTIVTPEVLVTRRLYHEGQEAGPKTITFGKPFTVSCEVDGSITLSGTNYNNVISVVLHASYSIDLIVLDGDGNTLSNGFDIVSSSGAVFPKSPPVMFNHNDPEFIVSWHSITGVHYNVAASPSLVGDSWTQMVSGVVGNGHTNSVVISSLDEAPLFIRLEME
ncbi:MAG TPA: hypothetical protein PKE26_13620 [Kiritimatiellia bacterium]|nr:hypothetical protein [Kiritimatiellia bacterium]HMP00140.1 hypothetical protein [Kiritimatiellia bacterium]